MWYLTTSNRVKNGDMLANLYLMGEEHILVAHGMQLNLFYINEQADAGRDGRT